MKRQLFFASSLLCSFLYGETLTVEKGWNLLSISGTSSEADCILNQLSEGSILWKYDNINKKWLAKSNSEAINSNLERNGISPASTLNATDGFWVYNPLSSKVIEQYCTESDTDIVTPEVSGGTTTTVAQTSSTGYHLLAWNDLGMHLTLATIQ